MHPVKYITSKSLHRIAAILFGLLLLSVVLISDLRPYSFYRIYTIPLGDKISHFFLMGGFAFVVNLALSCRTFIFRNKRILTGSAIVLTLVLLEEFSQIFFKHRSFSIGDIIADVIGIILFSYLALLFHRKLSKQV